MIGGIRAKAHPQIAHRLLVRSCLPTVRRPDCRTLTGARQRYSTAKASTRKDTITYTTTRVPESTRSSRVRELETAASRFGVPAMTSSRTGGVALSCRALRSFPRGRDGGGGLVQPG